MKILGKTATVILLAISFVGLCVLLYPSVSQYWNSKVQSKAVANYTTLLEDMPEEDYVKYLREAQDYNRKLSELDSPLLEYVKLVEYNDVLNVDKTGMMGYINIEKIGVELPIYHGTDSSVLDTAVGHIEGSSLPIGGESTHCALSAHRGLPSAKLFTELNKLEVGDVFTLTVLGEVLTYEVDQVTVVSPYELDDIAVTEGEDYCTLVTCTPYAINTHRLLVRGVRTETKSIKNVYVTTEAYIVDRLIVTPAVALPIILVLILIVMVKPVKKQYRFENEEEGT